MKGIGIVLAVFAVLAFAQLAFAGTSGPAPIPNPPNFYVTTNATTLCKGQVNYIPVTVSNKATTIGNPHSLNQTYSATVGPNPQMQNVVLSVAPQKGFYSVGNGTVDIGNVDPNSSETGIVPIFVGANVSSLVSVGIDINYFYYTYYTDTEQRNVTMSTQLCNQPLTVIISPQVLTAGSTQNLTMNITNNGLSALNTITMNVKFPNQYVAWLGTQQIEVNSILPGQTIERRSRIFVSYNASDEFSANVSATFYNGTDLEQIYQNVEMLASGLISLNTSGVTVSPVAPSAGSIFSISFTLTNTGTSSASAVTATVVPTNGFSSFESNSTFVGSIASDSQTPVTLTLEASNRTHGEYKIPVKISYLNTVRQPVNETIVIPVFISAQSLNASAFVYRRQASGGGGGLLIIILLLVIAVLAYLLYKEKKKAKKGSK